MNEELKKYIQSQIENGVSREEIKKALVEKGGWNEEDFSLEFEHLSKDTEVVLKLEEGTKESGIFENKTRSKKNIDIMMLIVFLGLVLAFFFFSQKYSTNTENIESVEVQKVDISTDKEIYKSGEQVNIKVSRGNFPPLGESEYLGVGGCHIDIMKNGIKILPNSVNDYLYNKECNEYAKSLSFDFNIERMDKKDFSWDQQACENKKVLHQAVSGDYTIMVDCGVADYRGSDWEGIVYGSIGDSTSITILEPQDNMCNNKQMEILNAYYNYNGAHSITVEIKNSGSEEIRELVAETKHSNRELLGALPAELTKEYSFMLDGSTYDTRQKSFLTEIISVYVKECFNGEENSEYYLSAGVLPNKEAKSISAEESAIICGGVSEKYKGECLNNTALYYKDPSICNQVLFGEIEGFFPSSCIHGIATSYRDANICEYDVGHISGKKSCYDSVISLMQDVSGCEEIKNIEYRNLCAEQKKDSQIKNEE